MGTHEPTRRERKKEQLRETLLTVALELFTEKGFRATTVEDIAEEADVAPRTFFRYFATKTSLLQPPTASYREVFRAALSAAPPGEPLLTTLHRSVRETLVLFHDNRDILVAQHRIIVEAELDIDADEFTYLWRAFQADLAELLGSPDHPDPRPVLLTGLAVGIAAGALEQWLADDAEGDLGVLVDDGFALLGSLVAGASDAKMDRPRP